MRVLFDAFWWVRGPIANRMVMREIIFAWARQFPEDDIILAAPRRHLHDFDAPAGTRVVPTRLTPQAIANSIELPLIARSTRADAVIAHNYAVPAKNSMVFIHDLLFEESPQWFSRRELVYFWPMSRMARFASVVATSSRSEARRIERLHPSLAPVLATGLAVSRSLAEADPSPVQFLPRDAKGFLLSVGRLNRRKNLEAAIEGASRSGLLSAQFPLVIVGSAEYSGVDSELPSDLLALRSSGKILFAGRVSDGELRWLYSNCDALLFMSRDEGYGLPPVEARFFGARTIVSDLAVMREVASDSLDFVDPDRPDLVAGALQKLRLTPKFSPRKSSEAADAWDGVAKRMRDAIDATAARK